MYTIEIRLANKNGWHTPAEARAYYGRYSRDGVTWHWWNTPDKIQDSDHDNICNYILGKSQRGEGSVNYVLSNNKITLLVNPDNVAWASQAGNPTTISVELSPHLNAEGYKKAGWLFNELEGRYGKVLQHKKHSDWFATACPGTIDVGRIAAEANKWKTGGYNPPAPTPPTPVPVPPSSPKNIDFQLWKDPTTYVVNKQPTQLWDVTNVTKWSDPIPSAKTFNKGEIIVIVGQFHNVGLNRDYYITKYSFDNRNATGFNAVDLDVYAPEVVVPPTPPEPVENPDPGDETPVEPTDPIPTPPQPEPTTPDPEAPPIWFIKLMKDFIAWISDKLKLGKE